MPWHAEMNPSVDHLDYTFIVDEEFFTVTKKNKSVTDDEDLCVTSIDVNKSRQITKSGDNSKAFELYQLHQVNSFGISENENVKQDLG